MQLLYQLFLLLKEFLSPSKQILLECLAFKSAVSAQDNEYERSAFYVEAYCSFEQYSL